MDFRGSRLRNALRTNLLLGLARLHLNDQDDVGTYHRLLREAAEEGTGHPASANAATVTGAPRTGSFSPP